jgi:hypothetical protein
MWQYRDEEEHEDKHYWQIAIQYEYPEPKFDKYLNGRQRLMGKDVVSGKDLDNLTKLQAEELADEMNKRAGYIA